MYGHKLRDLPFKDLSVDPPEEFDYTIQAKSEYEALKKSIDAHYGIAIPTGLEFVAPIFSQKPGHLFIVIFSSKFTNSGKEIFNCVEVTSESVWDARENVIKIYPYCSIPSVVFFPTSMWENYKTGVEFW
jgi:hypothetical protein